MKCFLSALLAFAAVSCRTQAADITITAANVVPSANAQKFEATAGATIVAGQLIYLDTADTDATGKGKAKLSDADSATAAVRVVDGMAINSASAGQPIFYITFDPFLTVGGSQTVNTVLISSSTAGGLAPAADLSTGEYLTVVAVVKSGTILYFRAPGLISGAPVPP